MKHYLKVIGNQFLIGAIAVCLSFAVQWFVARSLHFGGFIFVLADIWAIGFLMTIRSGK